MQRLKLFLKRYENAGSKSDRDPISSKTPFFLWETGWGGALPLWQKSRKIPLLHFCKILLAENLKKLIKMRYLYAKVETFFKKIRERGVEKWPGADFLKKKRSFFCGKVAGAALFHFGKNREKYPSSFFEKYY